MIAKNDKSRPAGNTPSGLPLLYKRPAALDSVRHLQAAINTNIDYSFARATNSIPLNAIEIIEAAKTYPVVFTNDENPLPVAIVGMEQENYFVRKDKGWQENSYIPAYVRQYPFIFFEQPEDNKFYLCVDEAAPSFVPTRSEGANALYTASGEPSELTNNALKFCTSFYQHHLITRNFCKALKAYNLLQPYNCEVVLRSGKQTKLSGFQMIDEKALTTLKDKEFLELRKQGWMAFIYLSLASITNWKNLVAAEANNQQ